MICVSPGPHLGSDCGAISAGGRNSDESDSSVLADAAAGIAMEIHEAAITDQVNHLLLRCI
jgi:hypothetical protein